MIVPGPPFFFVCGLPQIAVIQSMKQNKTALPHFVSLFPPFPPKTKYATDKSKIRKTKQMAPAKSSLLSLYRGLLKHGSRIPDYNQRVYVARRTKEDFRKELDEEAAGVLYAQGVQDLEVCVG